MLELVGDNGSWRRQSIPLDESKRYQDSVVACGGPGRTGQIVMPVCLSPDAMVAIRIRLYFLFV